MTDLSEDQIAAEREKMELVKASIKAYKNISCYYIEGAEADSYVTVPRTEECLQNFLCAIPAQLLGYRLSEERERIARAEARK